MKFLRLLARVVDSACWALQESSPEWVCIELERAEAEAAVQPVNDKWEMTPNAVSPLRQGDAVASYVRTLCRAAGCQERVRENIVYQPDGVTIRVFVDHGTQLSFFDFDKIDLRDGVPEFKPWLEKWVAEQHVNAGNVSVMWPVGMKVYPKGDLPQLRFDPTDTLIAQAGQARLREEVEKADAAGVASADGATKALAVVSAPTRTAETMMLTMAKATELARSWGIDPPSSEPPGAPPQVLLPVPR